MRYDPGQKRNGAEKKGGLIMSEEDKNNDKNQDYCYLCRRTEKVAGKLIQLPIERLPGLSAKIHQPD